MPGTANRGKDAMVKTFTQNKDGKIEFTRDELEKLLNEVWWDGKNHATYTWASPYWQTITTPTATITGTSTTSVAVGYSSENHAGASDQSREADGASP